MFTTHYKVRRDLSDTCRVDVVLSRIDVKNREVLRKFLVPLRCVKRVSYIFSEEKFSMGENLF